MVQEGAGEVLEDSVNQCAWDQQLQLSVLERSSKQEVVAFMKRLFEK